MIDTIRMDQDVMTLCESFTYLLQDFYRAHGGRGDKYHRSVGMFGLRVFVTKTSIEMGLRYSQAP